MSKNRLSHALLNHKSTPSLKLLLGSFLKVTVHLEIVKETSKEFKNFFNKNRKSNLLNAPSNLIFFRKAVQGQNQQKDIKSYMKIQRRDKLKERIQWNNCNCHGKSLQLE